MDQNLIQFQGISPRFDPDVKVEKGLAYARTAQNVDLTSGKIKAVLDKLLIESDSNHYNSLAYHNSAWEKGNDRYFCPWKVDTLELLFYLDAGVLYKKVGASTAKVGQTRPEAPITATQGAGDLSGEYIYVITTTRNVGGDIDESGPSPLSTPLTVATNSILVTRPTITDPDVTTWTIYRLSQAGGEYLLVAEVAIAETTYLDNVVEADLGMAIPTWYTSDQGNDILFDIPPTGIDGLAPEPLSGMLFFWIGPTLYWTEPGYHDAAPAFYSLNFPANIKYAIPYFSVLSVLTDIGPFRVEGTHPELLQQSTLLGNHPCISPTACKTQAGLMYLADAGIARFSLIDTTIITEQFFTEKWFRDNISPTGAIMIESDNVLYLFHSAGALVVDLRSKDPIFTTLSIVAYAAYRKDDEGSIYVIDANGIQKLEGATSYLTWTWRSGNILMASLLRKEFTGVEFIGEGLDIVATLYVDDVRKATKTIDFNMERDRCLGIPESDRGRALQISLSGSGSITEIIPRRLNE